MLERVGQPPSWSGSRALPLGWTVVTAFRIENLFNPTTTKWVDKRNFAYLSSNETTKPSENRPARWRPARRRLVRAG